MGDAAVYVLKWRVRPDSVQEGGGRGGGRREAVAPGGVDSREAVDEGGAAESSAPASAAFLRRGSRERALLCGATKISRGP
jgi:hypothetical protein